MLILNSEKLAIEESNISMTPWYQTRSLKGLTDIIIGNDGDFYILSGDKQITILPFKSNSINI